MSKKKATIILTLMIPDTKLDVSEQNECPLCEY